MVKIFNLEQLVEVRIVDKEESEYLSYKPFKKSFWGNTKEGFYDIINNNYYSKEDLENGKHMDINYIVENNRVYYNPYIKLIFANPKSGKVKEFNTYEEALIWGKEVASKGIKVQLIF